MNSDSIPYVIYCDGACSGNPGPGGWGSVLFFPDGKVLESSGFEPQTTNNRMELSGAIVSLAKIPNASQVLVLTDSVYVIRGITEWIFGWKKRNWKNAEGEDVLNKDLWIELFNEVKRLKVEWRYIRGHQGNPGNERADTLAVAAREQNFITHYSGSAKNYFFQAFPLPKFEDIPKSFGSSEKKTPLCYLSYVDGKVERHISWSSCESRVKGRSGARFKKVFSENEAQEVLKSWGAI